MSRIILETGRRADSPFFLEKIYVNLYSVEELCYILVRDAELLDQEIMSRELIKWLDEQCGLDQLAHTLYAMLNQKVSAAAFAGTILEYVKLYPEDAIEKAEEIIRANEGLSPWERKKAKADYLLSERRFFTAMEQYYALLEELPESEKHLEARIYHNLGVTYSRMFLYRQAAEWFMKAYKQDQSQESLQQYLAALRMLHTDNEYVDFIAEHPEYHDASMRVERMVEQSYGQFEGTDENRMLSTLQICKEEGMGNGTNVAYYDEIEKLTNRLKEQYREFTS